MNSTVVSEVHGTVAGSGKWKVQSDLLSRILDNVRQEASLQGLDL